MDMQEDSPSTHSVMTSRRGLLALAAGGALVTADGGSTERSLRQVRLNLPKASDARRTVLILSAAKRN